jgi:hypothetical protein
MDDGGLTLELDPALATRLRLAADNVGEPVQDYARALIGDVLDAEATTGDFAEEERRWAEYQRTGESYPAEQVLAEFQQAVARRFDGRD